MRVIDKAEVESRLSFERCIPIVREAMMAFSAGRTRQVLRSIIPLADGRLFGVMPGALGANEAFGAKLLSIYPYNMRSGRPSHQGVIVLFDAPTGEPAGIIDAGAVTGVRTAAASAVATEVLANPQSEVLAILGAGEQAHAHAHAIALVRPLREIRIWGRTQARSAELAARLANELGLTVRAVDSARAAVTDADIICTVSAAPDPILEGAWIRPGAHINLVGSSTPGPAEADHEVVRMSRFIADSREGVLAQGAEFLRAKAERVVGDDHVVGEIGEVLNGRLEGRQGAAQVTLYKSLGHVVQDLAAAHALMQIDGQGDLVGAPGR